MLRALFSRHGTRKARVAAVHDLVDALNSLDYTALRRLMTEDAVVIDAQGRKMEGVESIIEGDRMFREQADRPQIVIETLDHTREEVLVRAWMNSRMPEIDGPLLWRIEFEGERFRRMEVTRPADRLTAPQVAAQRRAN